jgi:hypothetical protein
LSTSLLNKALELEALGWSVIPIQEKSKKPAFNWKEFQSKRATREQITQWWTDNPKYNVGVVTGRISDLVVIDYDTKKGMPDAISIAKSYPEGPLQRTGGGGVQVFTKHPGYEIVNNVGIYNPDTSHDVDIRADGGYVVVAPSTHPSGGKYDWIRPPTDQLGGPPTWLVPRDEEKHTKAAKAPDWLATALSRPIPEGKRNDTLARVVGGLIRKNVPSDLIHSLLRPWWIASHRDEPRDQYMREFDATVASIVRAAGPRQGATAAPDDGLGVSWGPALSGRPPEWVIPGLVMAGSVQAVVGSPRAGKSWLTLMAADAVAKGKPFLGRETKQGRVLIAHEDSLEMVTQRLALIGGEHETKLHENIGIVTNKDESRTKFLDFKTDESSKISFEFLDMQVQRFKPSLMIFDALYRMVNLNDYAAAAPQQLDPIVRIARDHDCAILIVHHASKGGHDNAGMTGVGGWGSIFLDAFIEGGWNLKREFEEPTKFLIRMVTDFKQGMGSKYRLSLEIGTDAVTVEELDLALVDGEQAVTLEPL